ncbi:alpha/beta hydrolase [Bradyrhizobium prioriisuperbiae]|uniref:alpha/beta hydrolase n=1 Tax=Bradyrhizobium prioriisuperbiae TaxID=2854389 RepID=UPI0028E5D8F3|nr:alpha/beta hydrolase [Bradyrhizobium prioritasuperba]
MRLRLRAIWPALALGLAIALLITPVIPASAAQMDTKSYTIPSSEPGIQLFVRNKRRADVTTFGPDRTLLFVHGATYPAETAFDLPIAGASMMDLFADAGYDVWLVDVRGYGGSTRPAAMSEPPEKNKPLVSTTEAVTDFGTAVDHILKVRGLDKINVMGWSWGTSIVGAYTATHNDKVNRLVLYAPIWLFKEGTRVLAAGQTLGAYRLVSKASAKDRWLKDVPEDKKTTLIPPGVFEAWADATWATDPDSAKEQMLRAPNGVAQDVNDYWAAGKPYYDPGKITVPTLLIHAEWDADLPSYQAQAYFTKLVNTPYKRFVELGEGTHTVMMEKNRMQFFREIRGFLDEASAQALR